MVTSLVGDSHFLSSLLIGTNNFIVSHICGRLLSKWCDIFYWCPGIHGFDDTCKLCKMSEISIGSVIICFVGDLKCIFFFKYWYYSVIKMRWFGYILFKKKKKKLSFNPLLKDTYAVHCNFTLLIIITYRWLHRHLIRESNHGPYLIFPVCFITWNFRIEAYYLHNYYCSFNSIIFYQYPHYHYNDINNIKE